jgi:hypothetical protein
MNDLISLIVALCDPGIQGVNVPEPKEHVGIVDLTGNFFRYYNIRIFEINSAEKQTLVDEKPCITKRGAERYAHKNYGNIEINFNNCI